MELQKFSSQASPEILAQMKEIARKDGRQLQAVIEDAMRDYIAARNTQKPGVRIFLRHAYASLEQHSELYKLLAK